MAEEPTFGPKTLKHEEQPAPAVKKDAPVAAKPAAAAAHPAFGAGAFKAAEDSADETTATTQQASEDTTHTPHFGANAQAATTLNAEEIKASKVSTYRHGIAEMLHQINQFLNRPGLVFWLKYYALSYFAFRLFAYRYRIPLPLLLGINRIPIVGFIWNVPSWYVFICVICYPIFVWELRLMAPQSTRMSTEIFFGLPSISGELDPRYWALRSLLFMIKFIISGLAVVLILIVAMFSGY